MPGLKKKLRQRTAEPGKGRRGAPVQDAAATGPAPFVRGQVEQEEVAEGEAPVHGRKPPRAREEEVRPVVWVY